MINEDQVELLEKLLRDEVWARARTKLRNLVRITLRRWKYPPDHQKAAIELVLKQAEVLSEAWSQ